MLKTNDLVKIYRTDEVETTALNKVNLQVAEGEFVAIMGPSGCGHSPLRSGLGLLDNPIRIARIVKVEPHPNADKLTVCTVDDGSEEAPFQVVWDTNLVPENEEEEEAPV